MKNVVKPLAKSVSISLGLTAVASGTDAAIHNLDLVWSNEEMNYIMKIVKSLEESDLL